jgi:polyribonucleotide 5'-hydroxyl-kinase
LQPLWEWRFEVGFTNSITVRLTSGTAERDGTELALNQPFRFIGCKSKLLSWTGAELDVEGESEDYVAEHASPEETPMVSYLNLHFALQQRRIAAAAESAKAKGLGAHHHAAQQTLGPRVMIAGASSSGKTSLVRSLAAWATRTGAQAMVINTDPHEGMLSLPGTLSAAVFASIMDVESGGGGWGSAPSSGPTAVPVKLPLVHYFGQEKVEEDVELYRDLVSKLAGAVTARMSEDREVGVSGCIIDSPAVNLSKGGVDVLAHIVEEFSVNTIIVLGSARMNTELVRRFASETTSLGEPISIVLLEKSEGVVERDDAFMKAFREATIKDYFFGDVKRALDPATQQVDFDALTIYKIPERE